MTSTKPTILVIPGSFSKAYFYDELGNNIKALGYPYEVSDLPTASRVAPASAATLYDDAEHFAKVIDKLTSDGKNVVVVPHSYGGMVGTETVKGFTSSQPGKGKVIGIAYLTAIVPPVGQSIGSLMASNPDLGFVKMDGEFMYHDPPEISAAKNFSDLPPEEGLKWVKQMPKHSAISFANEATYAGYEDVDHAAYIFCTKDETLVPDFQRQMIQNLNEGRAKKGKKEAEVYDFESGHVPIASRPKDLAKVIVQAVEAWV
jgi:pimeloyl-ACP methyl ester carboxylesterase